MRRSLFYSYALVPMVLLGVTFGSAISPLGANWSGRSAIVSGQSEQGLKPMIWAQLLSRGWQIGIDYIVPTNFPGDCWMRVTNRCGAKLHLWRQDGSEVRLELGDAGSALHLPETTTVRDVMQGVERSRRAPLWLLGNSHSEPVWKAGANFNLTDVLGFPITNEVTLELAPVLYRLTTNRTDLRLVQFPPVRMKLLTNGTVEGISAPAQQDDKPIHSRTLIPLYFRLPYPVTGSVIMEMSANEHIEPRASRPRPPIMVPAGVTNISLNCPITSSDGSPVAGPLLQLTDGVAGHEERTNLVVLHKGLQWVQVDLGSNVPIYAVVVWHSKWPPKIVHGVLIQVADDATFRSNVRTLFNNDYTGGLGFGAGSDKEYYETNEGKLVEAKGICSRFVRFYSAGSTEGPENTYLAVEVFGLRR